MNLVEALEQYAAAATAHGEALESGDHRRANRAFDRMAEAFKELQSDQNRIAVLLQLTKHPDSSVRAWAATPLLFLEPKQAEPIIASIANEPGPVGFSAKMALQLWKNGALRNPFADGL